MRLKQARIAPVSDAEANADQEAVLARQRPRVLNVSRTLLRDMDASKAFSAWASYIMSSRNGLAPRQREIVILRTGFLCRSGYEWTQHVIFGKGVGLTDDEIARIKKGAEAGWDAPDAALIHAADELHKDQFVSDATWADLGKHFSQKQCMDVVFTAAQYTQVSMLLNSFGVQLDEGQSLDPDLDFR